MIEFVESTHNYLIDGVIVKSVTQILQEIFPLKYYGIPQEILERKAQYGTDLHYMIEIIETKKPKKPLTYIKKYCNPTPYQEESIKQYLKIKQKYNIKIIEVEKIVHYKNYYCGRLDIKAYVNGKKALIDIKTTSKLDKIYVGWQNSLYELADEPVEELYCMWLPKGDLGKLEKVERIDNKLIRKIIGEI